MTTTTVSPVPISRRAVMTGVVAGVLMSGRPGPGAPGVEARQTPMTREETMSNDPLPSWNEGSAKQTILDFVAAVTEEGGDRFVPAEARIATFDNDGTLWTEQPMYAQVYFILNQVKALAPSHPEWATEQPYAAVLSSDKAALANLSESDLGKIVTAAHAGMTTTEFDKEARAWAETGINPRTNHRFIESVYQPQLELMDYLRANDFRVFIVSGGGIDLMRVFSQDVYGVAPENVVGSSGKVKYSLEDGTPTLTKLPEVDSIDDHDGKPVNIHLHIGQKPILAFGNSDGDQQMLEYTTSGEGPSLALIIHHDDNAREVAYDRDSKIGTLNTAWDEATRKGWTVVSMKDDWKRVFAFDA